jgi:hypothetical protein
VTNTFPPGEVGVVEGWTAAAVAGREDLADLVGLDQQRRLVIGLAGERKIRPRNCGCACIRRLNRCVSTSPFPRSPWADAAGKTQFEGHRRDAGGARPRESRKNLLGTAGAVAFDEDTPFAILAFTVVGGQAVTIDIFNDRELVQPLVRSGG